MLKIVFCVLLSVAVLFPSSGICQVIQFGGCRDVETVKYFQLDKFLGDWYEIQRFTSWYELFGQCAYKSIQVCGRRVEIEHVYVKDGIQYVLHVNSTYDPGAEAVFYFNENSVDPVGIPLSVIDTDYTNYAVVYGCKYDEEYGIKYLSAWILSRERTLDSEILHSCQQTLNSIPGASAAYLETVAQDENQCNHRWTAHVQAENYTRSEVIKTLGHGGL